jgi:hypothetical protein
MKGNTKNLIIIGVIVLIIAGAAYYYFNRDQSGSAVLTSQDSSTITPSVDSDLLSALRELRKIKLDDSIFSSASWLSLHDFGRVLTPQQPFRPNPFAPLDSSAFSSATTTASAR